MQKFKILWHFYIFFTPQYVIVRGVEGGGLVFFIGMLIYWLVRRPCKNLKSYDNPFWDSDLVSKEWRACFADNNDVNRGHYVLPAVPKGIAHTSLIPIMKRHVF